MAGTHFRIDVDDNAAQAELKRLIDPGEDVSMPFKIVGEYLLREMWPRRFAEKRSPDGIPWAPVNALYAARKRSGRATQDPGDARSRNPADLLQLTGEFGDYPRWQLDGNALEFGVNTRWATTHQFGDPSRNIPARPFMGMDEQDQAEARWIFVAWLFGR